MLMKNFLHSSPSCFAFLDPGINDSGISVWRARSDGMKCTKELIHSDCIHVECTQESNMHRVRILADRLRMHIQQFKVNYLYVEEPPATVYQPWENPTIDKVIQRAQAVFKTVAACHGVIGHLLGSMPEGLVRVQTIFPIQWQPHHTHRHGMSSKEWSLYHANLIHKSKGLKVLTTRADENQADAVNIGHVVLEKLFTDQLPWK